MPPTKKSLDRELKRRMKNLALGLPVTTDVSDRAPVPTRKGTSKWQVAKWGHGNRRLFQFTCACGKVTEFALTYSDRKIYWSVYDPVRRGKRKRPYKERTSLPMGAANLTIPNFMKMLKEYEYEPKEPKSQK
jgi:hypothetical protein